MAEKAALLPVLQVVKQSYVLAWRNRSQFFAIAWCWILIAIPILLLSGWIMQPTLAVYCMDVQTIQQLNGHVDPYPVQTFMLSLVPSILIIGLGASIAVAWHRLVLRNEHVTAPRYLRFDTVVIHYFQLVFFLFCIKSLPAFLIIWAKSKDMSLVSLVMLAIEFTAIIYAIRVSVILPSRAVETNISLKEGWKNTHSNFWRLVGGTLLCGLPAILVGTSIILSKIGCVSLIASLLVYSFNTLLTLIITVPVYLSFLSLSYQHFFEAKEPDLIGS